MRSSSRGWRSRTAQCARSAASTSPPAPAASSACSVRTAPARPPPCGSSPRCSSPTPARARVVGLDVVRDAAELRAQIGLAGQYAAVDENLTGFENLEMVGRLYHLGKRDVPRARRRAARALRPHRRRQAAGQDLLRRHAPAARPRRRARRPPAGAVPRRADDRPGPAQPARHVGDDRGARGRRHDRAADDPVPRRGRPAGRPDRRDRPRQRDRRGHLRRAQGPGRRRAPRGRARGPGRRRRRDRRARGDGRERPVAGRTAPSARRCAGAPGRSPRPCGASTTPASAIEDIALRRPTLDDVFIALTGHAAEEEPEEEEVAA